MTWKWNDRLVRRLMRVTAFLAALAIPGYFAKFNPNALSAQWVAVIVVFLLVAGFSIGASSATPSKESTDDDGKDNVSEDRDARTKRTLKRLQEHLEAMGREDRSLLVAQARPGY